MATVAILAASIVPLLFYAWRISLRPPNHNFEQILAPGIIYRRQVYSKPRPYIVHTAEINLNNSDIEPFVTPPQAESNLAMTTSQYVKKFNLTIGVNGSFFYPFEENTPWDYYPHSGDRVNALGESIANRRYGKASPEWQVLCFDQANLAQIPSTASCPVGTVKGIAGKELLVKDSQSIVKLDTEAYGRTAIGINKPGRRLWMIVIDGKQPFYSEGVTQQELAQIAVNLGCDRAINLDGGGSTSLAAKVGKVKLLNAPIHTKIPLRERPVANHLGFKVKS